ncbi:MAG: hypothetical protein HQ546_11960, partial [Planctomycetes bacterium]|nr:hypothetical protein [Planctomycetota bacterium]
IRLSTIVIKDNSGTYNVDLTGADRLGDIMDKIDTATGGAVTVGIAPGGKRLFLLSATGNMTITELGAGRAAHDLGIYRPADQGNWFFGDDVHPQVTVTTAVGSLAGGVSLDLTSGIVITNGEKSEVLDFSSDVTVGDLLNRINTAGLGVSARINADATGIDVVNALSGVVMGIGENGGTTAEALGLRSMRDETALAVLNDGMGVRRITGKDDIRIIAHDGSGFDVDLSPAQTVQDVIDLVNAACGPAVTASLASVGNGVELTDNTVGAGTFSVESLNASTAAADMGLLGNAVASTINGGDVNPITPGGVFANLARLREALMAGDDYEITRIVQRIEDDRDHLVAVQGRIGGLTQDLQNRANRTEDLKTSNTALLSGLKDTNYAEAISRFQAFQTAMEANLQSAALMLNTSLLDFLR